MDVPVHHEGRAAHPSLVLCLLRITLLKDLLDHGLDQVGGNGKVDASGRGVGLAIFGTREGDADDFPLNFEKTPAAITARSNLSLPLCKLWSLKGWQGQILVRQRALLATARF